MGGLLTGLPAAIGRLNNMTALFLGGNQLTAVPDAIGRLTELAGLFLDGNQLTVLPEAIGRLENLSELDLSRNQLVALPDSISRLARLQLLHVSDNPTLVHPPREVQAQRTEAVVKFLGAVAASSVERWQSKVLVVGQATVGKTSLVKQLVKEAFDPGEGQTHGVRLRTLPLPHPVRPNVTMDLDVWDFGGQLEYRATQRFYLTDRSLFRVVWNLRARARRREGCGLA